MCFRGVVLFVNLEEKPMFLFLALKGVQETPRRQFIQTKVPLPGLKGVQEPSKDLLYFQGFATRPGVYMAVFIGPLQPATIRSP